jgi:hypothetical protein
VKLLAELLRAVVESADSRVGRDLFAIFRVSFYRAVGEAQGEGGVRVNALAFGLELSARS